MPSQLISFYEGGGRDSEGRTIDEILAWDDEQLEYCHDYIQWLFPTDRPSAFNPDAPIVTLADREEFANRSELRGKLKRALLRMLSFYGFACIDAAAGLRIKPGSNWDARKRNWLTPNNHNHLRITRMLTSLVLLGLPVYARAFHVALDRLSHSPEGRAISATSLGFWSTAAGSM